MRKMKSFVSVIIVFLGLSILSCHNEGKQDVVTIKSEDTVKYVVVEPDIKDTSTVEEGSNNIQEIVSSIVKGDKKKLASLCVYPITRCYPLPDIENAQQMVTYFDTLFDRSYRKRLAKEKIEDKVSHGWRGYSLGKETLWIYDSLYAVDYSSAKEKRKLDRLRREEMRSLNAEMRGDGWMPYACYKDLTEDAYIRIDVDKASKFRLARYGAGLKASDIPNLIMYGKLSDNWGDVSSEKGNITSFLEPSLAFYFSDEKENITINASVFEMAEDSTFAMYWDREKFKECHWLKPCYWLEEIKGTNIAR